MKNMLFLLMVSLAVFSCQRPVTVVQISDPQFGFYDRYDLSYETSTLGKAVEAVNGMKPDAVVFTGDLVHHPQDERQWQEFLRVAGMIDEGIDVFFLPGNHDGIINEGRISMELFNGHIGPDRFNVRIGNVVLTGINTNHVFFGDDCDPQREEQLEWLRKALKTRKQGDVSIVFGHHPFFVEDIDEADGYFQIPLQRRREYFDLFVQEGVSAYFSGHLHSNAESSFKDVIAVTTSAVGRPLGEDPSGIRIIEIADGSVSHRYVGVDELE